jgi:LPS sulfotransferase NodH
MHTDNPLESKKSLAPARELICITGAQRAGTTALQETLMASGLIRNYGEIFQAKDTTATGQTSRHSFIAFASDKMLKLSDTLTAAGATQIADNYFDSIWHDASPKHVLIDVKLNSWLALSPAWIYPHQEPFLLRYLRRRKAYIIFVWRKNLADQVVSAAISRELGIWHNLDPAAVKGRTITAPTKKLIEIAKCICASEADMFRHLQGYRRKFIISYEELFVGGGLSRQFIKAFFAMTGISLPVSRANVIRSNTINKRDVVTNYDETVAAINKVIAEHRLDAFNK